MNWLFFLKGDINIYVMLGDKSVFMRWKINNMLVYDIEEWGMEISIREF
jgi:hypothetical protein